jgi:hypothetical protein
MSSLHRTRHLGAKQTLSLTLVQQEGRKLTMAVPECLAPRSLHCCTVDECRTRLLPAPSPAVPPDAPQCKRVPPRTDASCKARRHE